MNTTYFGGSEYNSFKKTIRMSQLYVTGLFSVISRLPTFHVHVIVQLSVTCNLIYDQH